MQEQKTGDQMQPTPIFAANVRAYSDAWRGLGVTFAEQAKRCNMNKGQFSEMRSGKFPNPGVWTALRIAEGLRVSVDDLLTDKPDHRARVAHGIFTHRGGEG
jgi:transcriptional regulator with XRE-family HTH domain